MVLNALATIILLVFLVTAYAVDVFCLGGAGPGGPRLGGRGDGKPPGRRRRQAEATIRETPECANPSREDYAQHAQYTPPCTGAEDAPTRKMPLSVNELLMPESDMWKFSRQKIFQHELDDPAKHGPYAAQRIWVVKRYIRHTATSMDTPTRPNADLIIPEGFRVWKPPCSALVNLAGARVDIENLFNHHIWYRRGRLDPNRPGHDSPYDISKFPFEDQVQNRGLYFLLTGEEEGHKNRKTVFEVMSMLDAADARHLSSFCYGNLKHLAKIYGFTSEAQWEEFASQIQIVLLRYNPAYGIKLHIDNIARANSGPIATVSLGPPNVMYDLTPTLADEGVPIRLEMAEGDIVVLDGKSRLEWAHAIPFNNKAYKYTVIFKFGAFSNRRQVGYQKVIELPIYEMPLGRECEPAPAALGRAAKRPAAKVAPQP